MGLIQSVFCSLTFCIERVLTWACCAFVLMVLMFTIILLMLYGISIGYHYAQKELSAFAMTSRLKTETAYPQAQNRTAVRLLAVNQSEVENMEIYQTEKPGEQMYLEKSGTPVFILETERPPKDPEVSPHERDLARRLIGRFRRSRNNITTTLIPLLRSVKNCSIPVHDRPQYPQSTM